MAVFAAIAFATLLLEDNHFVTFYEWLSHFAYYLGAVNNGHANLNFTVNVCEKNAVEFHCVAFLYAVDVLNIQEAVLFCLELLALDLYDNVHFK